MLQAQSCKLAEDTSDYEAKHMEIESLKAAAKAGELQFTSILMPYMQDSNDTLQSEIDDLKAKAGMLEELENDMKIYRNFSRSCGRK